MGSKKQANSVEVSLQVTLVKDVPAQTLLTGATAVDLIGDSENSDVVLQPKRGEFIQAHSQYLRRNPYFEAHQSFAKAASQEGQPTIKIDVPFPNEFRTILSCIYANSEDYCLDIFSGKNLCPLFMNAQFLQAEFVVEAAAVWFSKNWSSAITSPTFTCQVLDESSLARLLTKLDRKLTATYILQIILAWATEWKIDGDCSELRKFVESQVDFKSISTISWGGFCEKYEHGISPMPVIDKDLDKMDHMSFIRARSDFMKEQLVRTEEINHVREKMKWCYRREGVNHLQNCRHLSMQYLELVRAAKIEWIQPFKLPAKTFELPAKDASDE
ncbi:hypothetical protein HDU98_003617 [Podochytrium sp. JEL0797]|nr:hypothetical protein HDU98_003617 [Podochytrium sp. JEL0797]